MRVLLTEDNKDLADFTATNLQRHGVAVDVVYSGIKALHLLENGNEYDVVILDLILPDIDGTRLLTGIKLLAPDVPVIALTAKDSEQDKLLGLNAGFDDYMVKPFSHYELLARLRVLFRSQNNHPRQTIKVGPIEVQPKSQKVLKGGKPIKLTLNEFRLLLHLVRNKGRKVSIEELLESVWDRNGNKTSGRVITTISRLRAKLRDDNKKFIKTHNKGYLIDDFYA